ncbi:hypothetical protein Hanom_Chr00s018920g01758591 [Helianthus anomalus]
MLLIDVVNHLLAYLSFVYLPSNPRTLGTIWSLHKEGAGRCGAQGL